MALAVLIVALEIFALIQLPDFAAQFERDQRRGDPDVQNIDVDHWQRMAAISGSVAIILAVPFVVAGAGLAAHQEWARALFLWSSAGVILFMIAGCIHYLDLAQVLHVLYAIALFLFGWWFLYRSRASSHFSRNSPSYKAAV